MLFAIFEEIFSVLGFLTTFCVQFVLSKLFCSIRFMQLALCKWAIAIYCVTLILFNLLCKISSVQFVSLAFRRHLPCLEVLLKFVDGQTDRQTRTLAF